MVDEVGSGLVGLEDSRSVDLVVEVEVGSEERDM
jgi:hypothetical protein